MHLKTRNVNTAFRELVSLFAGKETSNETCKAIVEPRDSRNGPVLMMDEPITITYTYPRERVLFNGARDANPFFAIYESLWMLAGRNDVESVAYYAKQMREYSDDGGKTLNGAYGYRWRSATVPQMPDGKFDGTWRHVDQLNILVDHLKTNPNSRRAVLQMWNIEDDLLKIGSSRQVPPDDFDKKVFGDQHWASYVVSPGSKDVCCNLSVMFSLREIWRDATLDEQQRIKDFGVAVPKRLPEKYLDITVTNRSNDLIWGCLGANFVHFSILQDYMAARLGAEVGVYHHFSNNLHCYEWNWKPDEWLADRTSDYYIGSDLTTTVPLIKDPKAFEQEMPAFVERYSNEDHFHKTFREYTEPFLETVAKPMMIAFFLHKNKRTEMALEFAKRIVSTDWRIAAENWLKRREK